MPIGKTIITALAGIAAIALETAGALKGSVGGPMTLLLLAIVAAVIAGAYDASSNGRGALGWIVSITMALVGTAMGVAAGGAAFESAVGVLQIQGRPGPIFAALMAVIALLGSWIALAATNRFR